MILEFERSRISWGVSTDTVASLVTCFLQEVRFNKGVIGTGLISDPVSVPAQLGTVESSAYVISRLIRMKGWLCLLMQLTLLCLCMYIFIFTCYNHTNTCYVSKGLKNQGDVLWWLKVPKGSASTHLQASWPFSFYKQGWRPLWGNETILRYLWPAYNKAAS